MAETLKTQTLNLPNEVVDSDWKDDIDKGYATLEDGDPSTNFEILGSNEEQEGEYISPKSVSKESINQIKNFQVKLAFGSLKKFRKKESALAV